MNGYDLAVVAIFLVSTLVGLWRGLVAELFSLLAWVGAIAAGWLWGEWVGELLFAQYLGDSRLRWLGGAVVLAFFLFVAIGIGRALVVHLLKAVGLSPFDRFLGAWFGLVRSFVLVGLGTQVLLWLGASQSAWWQSAKTRPYVEWMLAETWKWVEPAVTQLQPAARF